MAVATYSVAFSATGKTLAEANNQPANWPAPPAGLSPGQASALKDAVAAAIKALSPTDSFPVSAHGSQLQGTTLNVAASLNFSTHTVSVVIS